MAGGRVRLGGSVSVPRGEIRLRRSVTLPGDVDFARRCAGDFIIPRSSIYVLVNFHGERCGPEDTAGVLTVERRGCRFCGFLAKIPRNWAAA